MTEHIIAPTREVAGTRVWFQKKSKRDKYIEENPGFEKKKYAPIEEGYKYVAELDDGMDFDTFDKPKKKKKKKVETMEVDEGGPAEMEVDEPVDERIVAAEMTEDDYMDLAENEWLADHAIALKDVGVAVIPLPPHFEELCTNVRNCFRELTCFSNPDPPYAVGGFGALGTPDSLHHPAVRLLRASIYQQIQLPLARFLWAKNYHYIFGQCIIDRLLYRQAGVAYAGESWHRDLPGKQVTPMQQTWGGWVNTDPLGTMPQSIKFVPGTHRDKNIEGEGFAKLEDAQYNAVARVLDIPPNHVVIFNEKIVHAVQGKKRLHDMTRLFVAAAFSTSPTQRMIPDMETVLEEQGMPLLKSGQQMVMYPALAWLTRDRRDQLERWAHAHLKRWCLVGRTLKKQKEGEEPEPERFVPYHVMPSLLDLTRDINSTITMYFSYEPVEAALYFPTRVRQ